MPSGLKVNPPKGSALPISTSGSPTSGSWLKGQTVIDINGNMFLCTATGTPGSWVQIGEYGEVVNSFNGRLGSVTLQEGDVLSTFSNKGGIMVGTGAGSGTELAVGADRTTLIADSTQAGGVRWGSLTLTYVAGNLASNYSPQSNLVTTFLTTSNLAVGIWDFDFTATINVGAATSIEILVAVGSATATFQGSTSCDETITGVSTVGFSFIANITAAGTLLFQTIGSGTIYANTPTHGYTNATGYTAVKIG